MQTCGKSYVLEKSGQLQIRTYFAVRVGDQAQLFLFVTSDAKALEKYGATLTTTLNSVQPITGGSASPTGKSSVPEPASPSVKLGDAAPLTRGLWLNAGPVTKSRDRSSAVRHSRRNSRACPGKVNSALTIMEKEI